MFNLFKKTPTEFFSSEERGQIVNAVRNAEMRTAGEVRVFIENRCKFSDALDRAVEIFYGLKMNQTIQRNGVLLYIALKDRRLAIYADEGIHQKAGADFWNDEVKKIIEQFNTMHYADGIASAVSEIGDLLAVHFPYNSSVDKNELPDDIVFGA